ncbi:MAG TPA: galactose-1-phosphate uridylyltransferase [Candidatus Dormibacteraeota bacterium]|nr:galactose-1-phosphate uridylyltransferase [Candidatus Dormibacteraeota bacterium]
MPELRKDPITSRWVIIATERAARPSDYAVERELPRTHPCPLCPGNEAMTPPEVLAFREHGSSANAPGWWVRCVPNKFPALASGRPGRSGVGIYDAMNGVGRHEVIVESPDHDGNLATLDVEQIEEILWAYRDRHLRLADAEALRYVLIFKNHGRAAGATLEHPHSQLIATPIVPRAVAEKIDGAKAYYAFRERCVWCDVVAQDRADGARIVGENEQFVALAPFASRFPFETWVMPRSHRASYATIERAEIAQLASLLSIVMRRMHGALGDPPYNFLLQTAPLVFEQEREPYFHWHIEIVPRLTSIAGFEWGSGMYINPTVPEDAARILRETVA